jgi:hypothetical protein
MFLSPTKTGQSAIAQVLSDKDDRITQFAAECEK